MHSVVPRIDLSHRNFHQLLDLTSTSTHIFEVVSLYQHNALQDGDNTPPLLRRRCRRLEHQDGWIPPGGGTINGENINTFVKRKRGS